MKRLCAKIDQALKQEGAKREVQGTVKQPMVQYMNEPFR